MEKGIFLTYLLIVSRQDIKNRNISVGLLIAGGVLTCGMVCMQMLIGKGSLLQSILGAVPGILLLLIARFTEKAGYADGIIIGYIGILWGYLAGFVVTCSSLLLVSIFSIILLVLRKVKKDTRIPYIPFIAVVFWSVVSAMGG